MFSVSASSGHDSVNACSGHDSVSACSAHDTCSGHDSVSACSGHDSVSAPFRLFFFSFPFVGKEEWRSDAFKDFVQELVKTDPRWRSGLDEQQCYQWILLSARYSRTL